MKTVSFSIMPFEEVMDDFAKMFEAVRNGRRIPKGPREEVGFTKHRGGAESNYARAACLVVCVSGTMLS